MHGYNGSGWKFISLTLRLPVGVDIVTLELDAGERAALGEVNDNTGLGEGVEGAPEVAVLVDTNALGEPRHLREVVGRGASARNHLLAVDPDVDRLDVGAGEETVLGGTRARNTVDLGDGAVVASVAGENVAAVLEPVLLGISKADDGDEAVCHLASAGVNVHGVESDGSTVVGGVTTNLSLLSIRGSYQSIGCTYAGLGQLGVGVEVGDSEKGELHADVDEVVEGDDLDVVGNNAVADHLVAALDAREAHPVADQEGCSDKRVGGSKSARALEGTVGGGAERVGVVARNAHGESREGADGGALVVGGEEGSVSVADGEYGVGVADAQSRPPGNLHGAIGLVDGLDEAAVETLEELVGDDLTSDSAPVDEVADDLELVLVCRATR